MPSTTSSSVSRLFASSTVITPSLPTFCIASAIILPIEVSPFDEIVPTCATSAESFTFFEDFSIAFTASATAISTPRLRSIGFMPAATYFAPSRTIAWAKTVAVVVPSPALSLVFEATSRTIWAPMFSNLSSSSISLATVTPSLVIRGAPKLLSSTTLRPFGPSVTFTALARMSTPRSILSRASTENLTSLAAIENTPVAFGPDPPRRRALPAGCRPGICRSHPYGAAARRLRMRNCELSGFLLGDRLVDDAHDVGLLHDQEFLAVDLDLGARPFAEQHAIAHFDVDGDKLAGFVAAAGPHCGDLALGRLFLGRVGDDDAAG